MNKINLFTLVSSRSPAISSEIVVSNGEEAGVITLKITVVKDSNLFSFYTKRTRTTITITIIT
jgi:hypothetical protein